MTLSDDKKESLRILYESWGIDGVRAELAKNETHPVLTGDVVAFARDWIVAEEIKRERLLLLCQKLGILAVVLFSGSLALLLIM